MRLRAWICAWVTFGTGLVATAAWGDRAFPREGAPLFSISKSENRNQVAFAVRLDAACRPVGKAPVYAYWRMLERSPEAVEPLLAMEEAAYGIASQRVVDLGEVGGVVRVALRALPSRDILVRTSQKDATCVAEAATRIEGTPARLFNVHARIAWPFGVDSLLITGWAENDGRVVRETMHP
jgi:Domain of unknown function (DUF4833)